MKKQFAIKSGQALKFVQQLVAKHESTDTLKFVGKRPKCSSEIEFLGLGQKPVFSL